MPAFIPSDYIAFTDLPEATGDCPFSFFATNRLDSDGIRCLVLVSMDRTDETRAENIVEKYLEFSHEQDMHLAMLERGAM